MNFHKKKLPGVLPSAALAASVLMIGMSGQAFADCERGALDTLYCDENGDMVADLPEDKSKWNDPNTLIFAYTPVEDPAIYSDIWQPFIDHLSDVTGRDVRFFAVQSNSAQVEAMRSGRLHIAGFSTGPTPFAVNLAGAVPFALMGSDSGQFGYSLQVFTHVDSDIHEITDLKGKRVAHTSPTSNSGNQAPRALFPEMGIVPGDDYEISFSGSHDQSMLGVVAKDYDAAPVASEVVERMAARGLYDTDDVRLVWESDRFPTTSYNHAHNLHPDLVEKIREAFYTFKFAGTELGDEFEGVETFVPINYKDNWKVIRTIQASNGVQYTRDNLK
ncbi:phosphate/phosphite/phosphonate ABC transporter substrate-binding protein [Marinobacter salexigens]|uniref:phosphate/phosphite/phosphonate ABC transporter substrate-binding protein n=1 Tax=Marinobacter salexigens TaxID=1925763 RepID=UPI000C283419|nr:phosphate/phosphite/phosphonate ABC transporter substrate-binding protein [Marinobacter salexigens]